MGEAICSSHHSELTPHVTLTMFSPRGLSEGLPVLVSLRVWAVGQSAVGRAGCRSVRIGAGGLWVSQDWGGQAVGWWSLPGLGSVCHCWVGGLQGSR